MALKRMLTVSISQLGTADQRCKTLNHPKNMYFQIVFSHELKDANVILFQIVGEREGAPTATERTVGIIAHIADFPRIPLWIPQCNLSVYLRKMFSSKMAWHILQIKHRKSKPKRLQQRIREIGEIKHQKEIPYFQLPLQILQVSSM